jgi:hypothetical protein
MWRPRSWRQRSGNYWKPIICTTNWKKMKTWNCRLRRHPDATTTWRIRSRRVPDRNRRLPSTPKWIVDVETTLAFHSIIVSLNSFTFYLFSKGGETEWNVWKNNNKKIKITERDESPSRRHSLTVLPPPLTRTVSNPFLKRHSQISSYGRKGPDPRMTLNPANLSSMSTLFVLFFFQLNPNLNLKINYFFVWLMSFRRSAGIVALLGSVFVDFIVLCVASLAARLADSRRPPSGWFRPLEGIPASRPGQIGHVGRAGPHETGLDGRIARQPATRLVHQGWRHQRKGWYPLILNCLF